MTMFKTINEGVTIKVLKQQAEIEQEEMIIGKKSQKEFRNLKYSNKHKMAKKKNKRRVNATLDVVEELIWGWMVGWGSPPRRQHV